MSSAWSRRPNETAVAWLERLRAVNREGLEESYRTAIDDFILKAAIEGQHDLEELEADGSLGPFKDAYLRLGPAQREKFRLWLSEIDQLD